MRAHIIASLASGLLPLALLGGCGLAPSPDLAQGDGQVASQPASWEDLSGTVTEAEYQSLRMASYATFDQGIQDGTDIPPSLEVNVEGTIDGYVHDPMTIVTAWNTLSSVRFDLDRPAKKDAVAGSIVAFSFDSGSELISFSFVRDAKTTYASFVGDTLYPVEDPQTVQKVADDLVPLAKENMPAVGDEVPFEGGAYLWDANGDDTLEHLWVDVVDNGDEAPNVMQLRLFGGPIDTSAIVERGYGVTSAKAQEDERGRFLLLTYKVGDYYYHDGEAQCRLRLEGDDLVVEELGQTT